MQLYTFRGHVDKVIDGDTVDVTLDFGFSTYSKKRLRLLNVDTPERDQPLWHEATNFTKEHLLDQDVYVQTEKPDAFGRALATIYIMQDGEYVSYNTLLRQSGYIKPNSKWNGEE